MSKFCTTCGAQLDDNAAFCTTCGAAQAQDAVPAQETAPVQEAAPAQEAAPVQAPAAPRYQAPAAPQYQPVTPPQYPNAVPQYQTAAPAAGAASGTGVLVMGIIALSLACLSIIFCWVPFLNIIFAIPAIILGAIAKSKGGKFIRSGVINGKIKTGRILGLIGMILGIVFVVVGIIMTIVMLAVVGTTVSYYNDGLNDFNFYY